MSLFLLILYIVLLAVQLMLFALGFYRKNIKLTVTGYVVGVLSLIFSVLTAYCYDSLPGYGMMPGLTYFSESFFSYAAAGVFLLTLFVTGIVNVIMSLVKHGKGSKD